MQLVLSSDQNRQGILTIENSPQMAEIVDSAGEQIESPFRRPAEPNATTTITVGANPQSGEPQITIFSSWGFKHKETTITSDGTTSVSVTQVLGNTYDGNGRIAWGEPTTIELPTLRLEVVQEIIEAIRQRLATSTTIEVM